MNKIQFLFASLFLYNFTINHLPVKGQITPDNTLGNESSQINSNVLIKGLNADQINGGATRGSNLFHSFSEFNIKDGQRVYFANPSGVVNILTRVTGGNASNIFGTLGVDGVANLFLINPNGILFGKNASLDVQGSFVGTTANGLQFGNQGIFSATNPQAPGLLTINPNALTFSQQQSGAVINNQSQAVAGQNPIGGDAFGLRVPDGKSLLLVGGNVSMDGGELNAFGGNVELGGLAAPGNINLVVDGDNLRLGFAENATRADVSLTNQAAAFVTGVGGGNLVINAGNIDVLNGSILSAGIFFGTGTPETVAGDIRLNATGGITVADASEIRNLVRENSQGQGGSIVIDTGSFRQRDGAVLQASTLGQGNGGSVKITAKDAVSLTDAYILSAVEAGGVGKGGNIDINAASLSLTDSAQLLTISRDASDTQPSGIGDVGNVNVQVSGIVDIAGSKNGFPSGIFSNLRTGTVGNGGNITIGTGSFQLRDGAEINASTSGQGNGGSVKITATDAVSLKDNAAIFSILGAEGVGKGGNIDIDAASLSLTDGAQLSASTFGQGNAGNVRITATDAVSLTDANIFSTVGAGGVGKGGNIDIDAASLSLTDGAQLQASTFGQGNAGNVNVNVFGVVDIAGVRNGFPSAIFSDVDTVTEGNGGNITIGAGSFLLRDGAQLSASTRGQGNGGNVRVLAKDAVSLTNANIFSAVEAGGVGKGGNIDIDAASLSLTDGAQLVTITRGSSDTQTPGKGDAGNVNVNVSGEVDIAGVKNGFGSGIFSTVDRGTLGDGGNIAINAGGSFQLRDGAQLNTSTNAEGNGGNITINVGGSFQMRNGAQLSASTSANGNGGSVEIAAKDAVSLTDANIISAYIFRIFDVGGFVGQGGNINIDAASLYLTDGAKLTTSALVGSDPQFPVIVDAGNVNVNVSGEVDIAGVKNGLTSGISTSANIGTKGDGGNININSNSLKVRDGALLDARTQNNNRGGDITVNVNVVEALNGGQLTTTSSGNGSAGKITVNAKQRVTINANDPNYNARLANFPDITRNIGSNSGFFVNSSGSGTTGDIEINSPRITLDNQGRLSAESASGNGGNINLTSDLLLLRRGGQITTNAGTAQQGGDGGNININSKFIVAVPNENSDILANAFTGTGGNINIQTQGIFGLEPRPKPTDQSDITASSEVGVQGQVSIQKPDVDPNRGLIELPGGFEDKSDQIDQLCGRGKKPLGKFVVVGKNGSIPSNPVVNPMQGGVDFNQLATLDEDNFNNRVNKIPDTLMVQNQPQNRIVEAQALVRGADGTLYLVAEAANAIPNSRPAVSACANVRR